MKIGKSRLEFSDQRAPHEFTCGNRDDAIRIARGILDVHSGTLEAFLKKGGRAVFFEGKKVFPPEEKTIVAPAEALSRKQGIFPTERS